MAFCLGVQSRADRNEPAIEERSHELTVRVARVECAVLQKQVSACHFSALNPRIEGDVSLHTQGIQFVLGDETDFLDPVRTVVNEAGRF